MRHHATLITGIYTIGQLPELHCATLRYAVLGVQRCNVWGITLLLLLVSILSGRCPNKKRPTEAGLVEAY